MSSNTQKLRIIRSRTDRDLLVLVQHELDRGCTLVNLATSNNSPLFAQAVKAHDSAAAMLREISGLTDSDRRQLESRVNALRSRLDAVPAYANLRGYQASAAS
jgi:hypothetical protein